MVTDKWSNSNSFENIKPENSIEIEKLLILKQTRDNGENFLVNGEEALEKSVWNTKYNRQFIHDNHFIVILIKWQIIIFLFNFFLRKITKI